MSRGPRWLAGELAALVQLREVQRLEWAQVAAALPGRSVLACMQAWYGILSKRRLDRADAGAAIKGRPISRTARRQAIMVRALPPRPLAPAAAPAPVELPALTCLVSTAALRLDAELRGRIAELGVTGGLLGDPLPGRSALDRRLAGGAADPEPVDRRKQGQPWWLGPKITLAGPT